MVCRLFGASLFCCPWLHSSSFVALCSFCALCVFLYALCHCVQCAKLVKSFHKLSIIFILRGCGAYPLLSSSLSASRRSGRKSFVMPGWFLLGGMSSSSESSVDHIVLSGAMTEEVEGCLCWLGLGCCVLNHFCSKWSVYIPSRRPNCVLALLEVWWRIAVDGNCVIDAVLLIFLVHCPVV